MVKWPILFTLTAFSLGCGGSATQAPIDVGHVADLSGAGVQASRGIGLALDELNKDAKRPIRVRHADTQGKLDAFNSQAVRLVAVNHVVALIGGDSAEELRSLDSGRALGTEDQPGFLPILSPYGWRGPGHSKETILIGMSPQAQGKILASYAVQKLNVAKASILVKQPMDSAQLLIDAFHLEFREEYLKKNGATSPAPALQVLSYGKDAKLDDLLPRVEEMKPDAVLVVGPKEDLRWLSEKLKRPALLFGGPDGSLRPEEWNSSAKIYYASAFAPDKENADFVERYRKLYQEAPDVHAALAYEAMKILGQALQHSNNAEGLREELFKIKDLPGLAGPIGFDDKQQLQRSLFVLRLEQSAQTPPQKYGP